MAYCGPIWRDCIYTSTTSPLSYTISDSEGTLFVGKAYIRPDADFVSINVNKICENYLSTDLNVSRTGITSTTHANALKTFYLKNSGGTTLNTYKFLNCWDRNIEWTGNSVTLSSRVLSGTIQGQYILTTSASSSSVSTSASIQNSGSLCGRYVIYFLNRRGGWCDLPITGKVVKKDEYSRLYIERAYDNTTANWEKKPYRNNLTTIYQATTGYLTDEQSDYVAYNLFSSNSIYLHDTCTGLIQPALISDNGTEYRYFKNGKKLVNYTINIQTSQSDYIL